ncbi:hypothetical protein PBI_CHACHING_98 [Mycobacterium phage ChaChing]|uniref:gp98 n=1 Tax=Mycobacterium phage Phlyer TaxID=591487 RepID=UPI000192323C|nr:gp98 [Mycobacterium phage Phlyer]ACM42262.1 hypothetical protein PHLYER_98 [Mycobacterium phage Phlyer]AVJ49361.1 hypothetical protein PBI_CHACHING_98 [Mycobacterium phage ChaChing]UDG78954.1 hypothetical protein SEA_LESTYG_96 [Mycobacterium phage LestyG]
MIVYITQGNPEPVEVDSPFDGMIAAQNVVGQITWHNVDQSVAIGVGGPNDLRAAVIDLDAAGVRAIHAALWVAHGE